MLAHHHSSITPCYPAILFREVDKEGGALHVARYRYELIDMNLAEASRVVTQSIPWSRSTTPDNHLMYARYAVGPMAPPV